MSDNPLPYVLETITDEYVLKVPRKIGKYQYMKTLGRGSFAAVILLQHTVTKKLFACKVVSREFLQRLNIFVRFEQEVRIMQSMKHESIVAVEEVVYDPDHIYLILEYCSHGDLFQMICQCGPYREPELQRVFKKIVEGLDYIHSHSVAHRDLKPENILLDDDFNPKIADFGLCHELSAKKLLMTPCGSPFYAPPEIINNEKYDGKLSDIWSLGVVLFTMATGSLPWTEPNQTALFLQIEQCDFTIPSDVSPPIQALINMMMVKDPKLRPSTKEILNSPWLCNDEDLTTSPTPLKASKFSSLNTKSTADHLQNTASMKRPLIVRPALKNSSSLKATDLPQIANLIRKVPPRRKNSNH
ncbi:CAMK family protein kinase [Tritrichomonas foetus]|uniref:CAMK family protein kinase n=1 Tax=Tritrichomonas foetus TaxID=1144522 RepID=A0A1J4L3W7_9EUKA|nr:CAMK family protein kinase [Tritrichomonas foetus]|eukprot:OHT16613.1 CAMK family protein kinase [Tritrichomonas foetus]